MQRGPRVGVHGARVLALSHQLAQPLDVARRGGGVQLRRGDRRLLAAAPPAGGAGGGGGVARQLGRVAPDRPREPAHAGPLGGGECEVGQAELAAEAVVERGGEEEGEAGEAEVAVAEVVPLERVHLRVRVHVVHALDVHHHQLAARGVEGEAREGVGRGAVQAVEVERAGVVVVLHVGAALDGALDTEEHLLAAALHLDHKRVQEVDRLWRREGVVVAREALGEHLHLDVGEVGPAARLALLVPLGDVVVARGPVHAVEEGRRHLRHLLHAVALPHGALGEGLPLHLDHHLGQLPLPRTRVVVPALGELGGEGVHVHAVPRVVGRQRHPQRGLEQRAPALLGDVLARQVPRVDEQLHELLRRERRVVVLAVAEERLERRRWKKSDRRQCGDELG
mmetsp:Transcript_15616/g.51969  ORF Transcript_15616/g.51969 Transcript_15616/m.51969 type:complete len:395 (+) Transcript_15616:619-1803(+)